MLISNQMIWSELQEQKKILNKILTRDLEHSIEEISLSVAARRLKVAPATLFDLAEQNDIAARKYKTKKSPKGYSYKFKVFDIHNYQRKQQHNHLLGRGVVETESIEELTERVFRKNK